MSLKHRLNALERPQHRGIIDVATLQARGAAVASGDTIPMSCEELTDLGQKLFNRPPHKLALEVITNRYEVTV